MYQDDNGEIKELLKENQRLLIENNQLLHKMRRHSIIGAVFRLLWFVFVIGIILYGYYHYVKPNWENLTSKISELEQASKEVGEAKEWFNSLNLRAR
ncbi:MAG: hypothetical protein H6779_04415 [Candidatus Nomurabacteria bacterium]|nr:MAG: hypothetical protein H6779_04415 [Candidatus Nomurabacteria bacterium]